MAHIRIACQTYTWEMLGDGWRGQVDDLLDWIAAAGYDGIEITNRMIGAYRDRPQAFAEALAARNLALAAFAYSASSGFTDPEAWDSDIAGAQEAITFLRHFPEPRLALGGAAHPNRADARAKLDQALRFYNAAGELGTEAGIAVNVHPHSHYGSLLESAAEYGYLMDHLDPRWVSLGPDTGHIVRGGQDLLACLRRHLPRITHLHLKDALALRVWVPLGEGVCDFPAVMALLEESGYGGWVVAEEESDDARRDGVAAIRKNRTYFRSIGY